MLFRSVAILKVLHHIPNNNLNVVAACLAVGSCMKEMAVFISMGEKKIKIFLQAMLESAVLFLMAAMAACGLGTYTAGWLQSVLISSNTAQMELQISLQAEDMALLLAIGGAVVLLSVFLSVLPILRTNPRETLSRMEG